MDELQQYDIVQLDPTHDTRFGPCLIVVDEVKSWGIQGWVWVPNIDGAARAYYRVAFDKIVKVGHLEWEPQAEAEDESEDD